MFYALCFSRTSSGFFFYPEHGDKCKMMLSELSGFIFSLNFLFHQTKLVYSLEPRKNLSHYCILALLIPCLSDKSETNCISDFDFTIVQLNYETFYLYNADHYSCHIWLLRLCTAQLLGTLFNRLQYVECTTSFARLL